MYNSIIEFTAHLDQQSLIDIIADMGIEFMSSLQQSVYNFRVKASSSDQDIQFNEEEIWGIGYYLLNNGREGFLCHNDFTRSTSGLIDIATTLLRGGESEPTKDGKFDTTQATIDISDNGPWSGDIENEANTIIEVIQGRLEEHPEIKEYTLQINGRFEKKTVQNSKYANIVQKYQQGLVSIELMGYNNKTIVDTFGGVQKADLNLDHILNRVDQSIEQIIGLQSAKIIKPGKYPVLLSPDSAYSLIHESIGHGCEADQIISGKSFLSNRIGHKVTSSNLTITDDPHLRNCGWSEYDDEGTKTKGTLLVEDGILIDYLHTNKTAKLMESPTTGNGRTSSYLHPPEPRQSNLFVEPKEHSMEELIEEIEWGIYFGSSNVASTSIYTGDVHIGAQYGQRIENGELTDYVLPLTMTGNALNLLNRVDIVGAQVEKFPTECLKSKSRLDIGAYCPPLMVNDAYLQ